METKYIIKGIWDDQEVYYVETDYNNTFFNIPVIRLSTTLCEAKIFNTIDEVEEAYNGVSHVNFKIYPICPLCQKEYDGHPAISRKDNKTEICPDCGIKEALIIFYNNKKTTSS